MFNLTDRMQPFSFCPGDIPDLEVAHTYRVYDYFSKKAFSLDRNEKYEGTMEPGGFGWYVILPEGENGACLGLLDKYAGFTAMEKYIRKQQQSHCDTGRIWKGRMDIREKATENSGEWSGV